MLVINYTRDKFGLLFTTNNCYCFTPTLTILTRQMMRWVMQSIIFSIVFQGEAAKPVNS